MVTGGAEIVRARECAPFLGAVNDIRGIPGTGQIVLGGIAKTGSGIGKAVNAGGVATSGLEMSQNSLRMNWTREEVDSKLHAIMKDIHSQCVQYGRDDQGKVDYVKGANIAGFVKVADAMIDQGVV